MASPPTYRVLLYETQPAAGGGFGIGPLIVEMENVKNIGWEKHLNDVGSAFWTLNQDDAKIAGLRAYGGTAHVQIIRNNETCFRGLWAEWDANGEDVIFYAYGYEHLLHSLLSSWGADPGGKWQDAQIDTIVTDLWTRAKTTLTYSPLGFCTTGTIQAPVTTSGGATAIVLPYYRIFYKRILYALRELAAMSISDTTNTVYFELAHALDPTDTTVTFNFWKNKSTDRADVVWEYPNGTVSDFNDIRLPVETRNDLFGIGSAPNDILLNSEVTKAAGATGYETFGRRQEPLVFSWVRDDSDMTRVLNLRLARAILAEPDIRIQMLANSVVPPGLTGAGYNLGDRVGVKLSRGITSVDEYMFVSGVQVIQVRGQEFVQPWLMERSGS